MLEDMLEIVLLGYIRRYYRPPVSSMRSGLGTTPLDGVLLEDILRGLEAILGGNGCVRRY